MSMKELARRSDALPLNDGIAAANYSAWNVTEIIRYEGSEGSTTWDENLGAGCLCDSTWPVGLGPGERQSPEFFGADCSLRHCPSGDDPLTAVDETDCRSPAFFFLLLFLTRRARRHEQDRRGRPRRRENGQHLPRRLLEPGRLRLQQRHLQVLQGPHGRRLFFFCRCFFFFHAPSPHTSRP